MRIPFSTLLLTLVCLTWTGVHSEIGAQDLRQTTYTNTILPFLQNYCFDCHAGGAAEGKFQFDGPEIEPGLLENPKHWHAVLKNVRSELMPPVGNPRPTQAERVQISDWIETLVFEVDPLDPDPGYVPPRRLNRAEYRNTIRDLMAVDFNADVVFPPDDTGFGFDNLGDALSISPLLMEKYIQSAKTIVDQSVPTKTWSPAIRKWTGGDFRTEDGKVQGSFIRNPPAVVLRKSIEVEHDGEYQLVVVDKQHGSFDFDARRYHVEFFIDGQSMYSADYQWDEAKEQRYTFSQTWSRGPHELSFHLTPIAAADGSTKGDPEGETFVGYSIATVQVEGPNERSQWVHPENYDRFFHLDEPPSNPAERQVYAKEILTRFGAKAFRRPPSDSTIRRLVDIAETVYSSEGHSFEAGIAQAIVAALASPRFLFKVDESTSRSNEHHFALIDEYSLASRLSYFLWSTMPDDELRSLADRGELRNQLGPQIERMMADKRSEAFIKNFVGQWLRARDVEHVSIDPIFAMGHQKEFESLRTKMAGRFRRNPRNQEPLSPEEEQNRNRFRELLAMRDRFDTSVRDAMRQETEMSFEHIVRENRSLLELLDADYLFVNDKLAKLYGIDGIEGGQVRKVSLPADSIRGGILTQGTMLTVTSNPTRTSPVKRGLFVLDNILGTPAPPAPPNVPPLEDASDRFEGREPTLRELLEVHRETPLCASCHARMDNLGIALENFNAFGMYRELDNQQPIDPSGSLLTGESFTTIKELKKILTSSRRMDYYRCVTEKLLVYALGRGLERQDEYTIDKIARELDRDGGRFGTLLQAVIASAPFQKQNPK